MHSLIQCAYYLFDAFFEFRPRYHQRMPATQTFDAEVGAGPQYFPLPASAGMLFFQFHDISYLEFVGYHIRTLLFI